MGQEKSGMIGFMKSKSSVRAALKRARPAKKKTAARTPKAVEPSATAARIIECARQVLLQHGHAAFTTRRVAEAAGMTHGHLNYHFPSKRDLLRALIAHLLKFFSQRFEAFLMDPNYPLGEDVERLARSLWSDSISYETVRTFRELWALSVHDPVICRAVDDFYDGAIAGVSQILRDRRPKVDPAAIDLLVQLLGLISEGGTVIYGTRRERAVPHERILDVVPILIRVFAPDLLLPTDEIDGAASQAASEAIKA